MLGRWAWHQVTGQHWILREKRTVPAQVKGNILKLGQTECVGKNLGWSVSPFLEIVQSLYSSRKRGESMQRTTQDPSKVEQKPQHSPGCCRLESSKPKSQRRTKVTWPGPWAEGGSTEHKHGWEPLGKRLPPNISRLKCGVVEQKHLIPVIKSVITA